MDRIVAVNEAYRRKVEMKQEPRHQNVLENIGNLNEGKL